LIFFSFLKLEKARTECSRSVRFFPPYKSLDVRKTSPASLSAINPHPYHVRVEF
jgi:hypothetical protein